MSSVAATSLGSAFAAQPRSRFAARFQYLYAMFAIAIYEGAFTQSFRYARGEDHLLPGETEITSTITQAIILSVLVILVWIKRGEVARALKDMLPYLMILALCTISALWSEYPFPTLRRSVTLTSCVFFGIYCYVTFGLRGTVALLGRTTVVLALLSLAAFLLLPSVGRETAFGYEGAMRGVFPQKNTMGEAMLLAISCYLYQLIEGSKSPRAALAAIGLLLVSIVIAQSATSLVLAIIVIAVGLIFYSAKRWRLRWIVVYGYAMVASLILIVVVFDSDAPFAVLNRDPSFTGRHRSRSDPQFGVRFGRHPGLVSRCLIDSSHNEKQARQSHARPAFIFFWRGRYGEQFFGSRNSRAKRTGQGQDWLVN